MAVFTARFHTVKGERSAVPLTQLHNRCFQQSNQISQTGSHCAVIEAQLYVLHGGCANS